MTIAAEWSQHPVWAALPAFDRLGLTLDDVALSTDGREWPSVEAIIGVREIDGWWETAPDATESFSHPTGDGTIDGYLRRGARTITLKGDVRARTAKGVAEAFARLRRIPRVTRLVIDERAIALRREADVRVVAIVPDRRSDLHTRYTATLHAADPLLYSTATLDLVNGANALMNRGDESARPTLELVGPHSAITVAHGGGSLVIGATGSGVSRVVDLRRRVVWQGGVRVDGVLSGPSPAVPVGGASWTVSGKGSGALRARRFEAWS